MQQHSRLYRKLLLKLSLAQTGLFIAIALSPCLPVFCLAQGLDLKTKTTPLSPIDKQYFENQRNRVERLANKLGTGIRFEAKQDVGTLQNIIDRGLVSFSDTSSLQALGVVFGDLLRKELDMYWVVYTDEIGRTRALRYRETNVYLFPVTMISRRIQFGSNPDLRALFEKTVAGTAKRLPNYKWLRPYIPSAPKISK